MKRGVVWVVAATIALSTSGCETANQRTNRNTNDTVVTLKRIEKLLIDIRKQNDLP